MPIHIAASGSGTRIKLAIRDLCFGDLPKHLLPTGSNDGQTLLGRNLEVALNTLDTVFVHANKENMTVIHKSVSHTGACLLVDPEIRPLGPFSFLSRLHANETAASIAGDVYIEDHDWAAFMHGHQLGKYPLSFLVGRVGAGAKHAVFDVNSDDGRIERFRRLNDAEENVYRNIGVYAVTMTTPLLEIVNDYTGRLEAGQEDKFVADIVTQGLVRAHVHGGRFFNINGHADYQALLSHINNADLLQAQ